MKASIIKFFLKFFLGVGKLLGFLMLCWALTWATSFLSRWTPDSGKNPSHLCFVAVEDAEQFVPFSPKKPQAVSTKHAAIKDTEWAHWELGTDDDIRQVYYFDTGGDYFSWFRYRVAQGKVMPLSCQLMGAPMAMAGGFLAIFLLLLFAVVKWVLAFWPRRRQLP